MTLTYYDLEFSLDSADEICEIQREFKVIQGHRSWCKS